MCASGGACVDQLVRLETRRLLKTQEETSSSIHFVIGRAVEGPFVTAKKIKRQSTAELRQNPFAVRSCLSLATRNQSFAVGRQVNAAFSKVFHAISLGIRCAKLQKL